MKSLRITLSLLTLAFLLPFMGRAQESPVQQWLHAFEGRNDITTVSISGAMFKMLSRINASDPDYQDIVRFAAKLQDFKIVVLEGYAAKGKDKGEFNRLLAAAPLGNFEELMSIREKGDQITFWALQQNNYVRELIMTVSGSGDQVIIFIKGNFKLSELTGISDNMNITGMDKIKKIKK